jgi:hypothetical protein
MLERTVEEQQLYLYWHRRKQERTTARKLLHESDELVYWLEECLVQNRRLVPSWLLPRLVRLIGVANPELLTELGRERRPDRVLDVLFRAQEALMELSVRSRRPARVIQLFPENPKDEPEPSAASSG